MSTLCWPLVVDSRWVLYHRVPWPPGFWGTFHWLVSLIHDWLQKHWLIYLLLGQSMEDIVRPYRKAVTFGSNKDHESVNNNYDIYYKISIAFRFHSYPFLSQTENGWLIFKCHTSICESVINISYKILFDQKSPALLVSVTVRTYKIQQTTC